MQQNSIEKAGATTSGLPPAWVELGGCCNDATNDATIASDVPPAPLSDLEDILCIKHPSTGCRGSQDHLRFGNRASMSLSEAPRPPSSCLSTHHDGRQLHLLTPQRLLLRRLLLRVYHLLVAKHG